MPFYSLLRVLVRTMINPLQSLSVARHEPRNDVKKNKQSLEQIISFKRHDFEKLATKVGFDQDDYRTSWHWIIIPALIQLLEEQKNEKPRILEIGTFDAKFTRMLVDTFDCEIHTIDLPDEADEFINSYAREDELKRRDFIALRNQRLDHVNIQFYELDSIQLLNKFPHEMFDLIWVDGDHLSPQVGFDLLSALWLCKPSGFICCDDVMTAPYQDRYVSNESFKFLKALELKGLVDLTLLLKRCKKANAIPSRRKFVSVSRKLSYVAS